MPDAFAPVALLLIAHGSQRGEANRDLHELAQRLRDRGSYLDVVASFLELVEPTIPQGAESCVKQGAKRVVLLPYFLSAGRHVRQHLVEHCDALAARFPEVEFVLAEALGPHPLLDQIVLERAADAVGQGSVRLRA